jgi:hypothetical protein
MQYARELIAQMIADEPENRITSSEIVQYLAISRTSEKRSQN